MIACRFYPDVKPLEFLESLERYRLGPAYLISGAGAKKALRTDSADSKVLNIEKYNI